MSLLHIILIYLMNIRSYGDLVNVQRVFLLENDFLCANQEQFESYKRYLYDLNFTLECKNNCLVDFRFYSKTRYPLKSTNLSYIVLKYSVIDCINSFLKSPEVDKFFFRIFFSIADEPIGNSHCFDEYKVNLRGYHVIYKLQEIAEDKSIKLICDKIEIRKKHIKKKFESLQLMNMLKFNEYIEKVGENLIKQKLNKIENYEKFDLYYFKDYFECLENLKKFIKDVCCYKLKINDISEELSSDTEMSTNKTTNINILQFKTFLWVKCIENLRKLNFETGINLEMLFDRWCDYLKNTIQTNSIILPIIGKYDINYYIEQFSNIINELVKQIRELYDTYEPVNENSIWDLTINSFLINLDKLVSNVVQDLFIYKYVPNHFNDFLGKEVETLDDLIKVEKMVNDYYNIFIYIFNLYREFEQESRFPYSCLPPIFIENYNLRIIYGIMIEFKIPTVLPQIKGFDDKGEEIIMEKDIDYFSDESILYCPSEVLKIKNIQEIEVILSESKKNNKRFKTNEYLSN